MWAHRENSVCLTNHPRVEFRRSAISDFWNQSLRKRSERIWNHNHGLESIEHVVRSPYMWWFHTMVIFWDIATVSFICQLDKIHIHLGISIEELPKSWPLGMSVELFLDFFNCYGRAHPTTGDTTPDYIILGCVSKFVEHRSRKPSQ